MQIIFKKLKKDFLKKEFLFFGLIFALAIFFRFYRAQELYTFELDQDLFSWIVKDILINHHIRLIGQLTSIDGVFIGPLYYYLLVPFFFIFKMNPSSALIPAAGISIATIFSIYYVFSKFFGKSTGIIGSLLYSFSLPIILIDRWVVPTQTTFLWSIWYLWCLVAIKNGSKKAVLVAGVLVAMIWQVHIALVPLVFLLPVAIYLSRKKITLKFYIYSAILFLVFSSPFWLFELRHNFQQIRGFITATTVTRDDTNILWRLYLVIGSISIEINRICVYFITIPWFVSIPVFGGIIFFLKRKKLFKTSDVYLVGLWILLISFSQFISKRPISDYYFNSLIIPTLLVFSLLLAKLSERYFVRFILALLFIALFMFNFISLSKMKSENSFLVKKKLVETIKQDALQNNYPCISVTLIADLGTGYGFRYLLWYEGLDVINPAVGIPNYDILVGWDKYAKDINLKFGYYGLNIPHEQKFTADKSACSDPKNQPEQLLNFTN